MTEQCVPGVTLQTPTLPTIDPVGKDVDNEIATALEVAAIYVVTQAGGEVLENAVFWGAPRAFPACCDTVAVGIQNRGGSLDWQDGQSWTPRETTWEVLVSQSRPKIKSKDGAHKTVETPASGFGDDTPSTGTITGHAYLMSRINTLMHQHLCAIARTYLPADCVACQCLQITAVSDERDTCDQIRFTVNAVTK